MKGQVMDGLLCTCLGSLRAGPCSDAAVCSVLTGRWSKCAPERGKELAEVSGLTAQLLSTVQNELVVVSLTIPSFLYKSKLLRTH